MLVTCICVCHDKPDITHEAIESIVNQTHYDWQALVVDSGVLYDSGYYENISFMKDTRIELIRSSETEETRNTKAMAPWCFNECFRKDLVKGDLVMYLCDDDLLYPNAFETFVSYSKFNEVAEAMYASQHIGLVYSDGTRSVNGYRIADKIGGKCVNGRNMDCEVDYLQFCHKKSLLSKFPDNEYWPESKQTEWHADGVFMERCGLLTPIYPINIFVSQNRRTPKSTYKPLKDNK